MASLTATHPPPRRRSTIMTRLFRSFIVFYNSFVLICALALLGLATYVYVTWVTGEYDETELRILLLILLTVAGLEASIAIFGITGAIFESQACLLSYAFFLFIFSVCQIAAIILGSIHMGLVVDFTGKGVRRLARIVDLRTRNSDRPVSMEQVVTERYLRRCHLITLLANGAFVIVNLIFIVLALTVHRAVKRRRRRSVR